MSRLPPWLLCGIGMIVGAAIFAAGMMAAHFSLDRIPT